MLLIASKLSIKASKSEDIYFHSLNMYLLTE